MVGPNGAGKSTLLLLAAGMRRPTSGTVKVFDADPTQSETRSWIGVLPDRPALPPELSPTALLHLVATAHGLAEPDALVPVTLQRLGLESNLGRIGSLSAGLHHRLALAVALLPRPRLLLLDEPLAALDPASVSVVRRTLAEERERGATLVLATHRLTDVAQVCDRVIQVVEGTVDRLGTVDHVLVQQPARVLFGLPPGAEVPGIGVPLKAPPGLFVHRVPATRKDALIDQIRQAGGAVMAVVPLCDRLTSGQPREAEETLA